MIYRDYEGLNLSKKRISTAIEQVLELIEVHQHEYDSILALPGDAWKDNWAARRLGYLAGTIAILKLYVKHLGYEGQWVDKLKKREMRWESADDFTGYETGGDEEC